MNLLRAAFPPQEFTERSRDIVSENFRVLRSAEVILSEKVAKLKQLHGLSLTRRQRRRICAEPGGLRYLVDLLAEGHNNFDVRLWAAATLANVMQDDQARLDISQCQRDGCNKKHTRHNCGIYWLWLVAFTNDRHKDSHRLEIAGIVALLNASANSNIKNAIEHVCGLNDFLQAIAKDVIHRRKYSAAVLWNLVKSEVVLLKLQVAHYLTMEDLIIKLTKILRSEFTQLQLEETLIDQNAEKVPVVFPTEKNLPIALTSTVDTEFSYSLQLTHFEVDQSVKVINSVASAMDGRAPEAAVIERVDYATLLANCPGTLHVTEAMFKKCVISRYAPLVSLRDKDKSGREGDEEGVDGEDEGLKAALEKKKMRDLASQKKDRVYHCLLNLQKDCVALAERVYSVDSLAGSALPVGRTMSVFEICAIVISAESAGCQKKVVLKKPKKGNKAHSSPTKPEPNPKSQMVSKENAIVKRMSVGEDNDSRNQEETLSPASPVTEQLAPKAIRETNAAQSLPYEPKWEVDSASSLNDRMQWEANLNVGDQVIWRNVYAPAMKPMREVLQRPIEDLGNAFIYSLSNNPNATATEMYVFGACPPSLHLSSSSSGTTSEPCSATIQSPPLPRATSAIDATDLPPIWGSLFPTRTRCLKELMDTIKVHLRRDQRLADLAASSKAVSGTRGSMLGTSGLNDSAKGRSRASVVTKL